MSHSDEEDDFLSADEDTFDSQQDEAETSQSDLTVLDTNPKSKEKEIENSTEVESEHVLPPAPPPTPALSSSSFNQLDDQAASPSKPLCPSVVTASATTQYGWRMPSSVFDNSPSTSQPGIPGNEPVSGAEKSITKLKSNQARLALDRLSEELEQSEQRKNLVERVVEDLKKVSIRSDYPVVPDLKSGAESALPLITDLGTTIGGWGWLGATKLLSSASQVTSQVGSVLDSVLNAPNPDENAKKIAPPEGTGATAVSITKGDSNKANSDIDEQ